MHYKADTLQPVLVVLPVDADMISLTKDAQSLLRVNYIWVLERLTSL